MDNEQVYYSPSRKTVIDVICADGLTQYARETEAQMRERHADIQVMSLAAAFDAIDAAFREPVSEIDRERYWYLLEVLPPVGWTGHGTAEQTFKLSERTCGNITAIACQLGERYFTLEDDIRTPHREIVRRCREFMAQVAA